MVLPESRSEIDQLDHQLLELLAERLKICRKISDYKRKNNLPIQDRKRELEVIKDRIKKLKGLGVDDEKFVTELFELIMKKSREVQ